MRKLIALSIATVGLAAAVIAVHPDAGTKTPTSTPTVSTVQPEEDQPGWDCRTMGNKVCGPTPTPVVIVTGSDKQGYWKQENGGEVGYPPLRVALAECHDDDDPAACRQSVTREYQELAAQL